MLDQSFKRCWLCAAELFGFESHEMVSSEKAASPIRSQKPVSGQPPVKLGLVLGHKRVHGGIGSTVVDDRESYTRPTNVKACPHPVESKPGSVANGRDDTTFVIAPCLL